MDQASVNSITQAEAELRKAESVSGMESLDVAVRLEELARLFEQFGIRKLDSVNLKARAKVIRSKLSKLSDLDEKDCPYCAEKIKKNAVFCRFCREDLVATKQAKQERALPVLQREVSPLLVLGLVAAFVWIVVVPRLQDSHPQTSASTFATPSNPLIGRHITTRKSETVWTGLEIEYDFVNDHEVEATTGARTYPGTYTVDGNDIKIIFQDRVFHYTYNGLDLHAVSLDKLGIH